MSTRQRAPPQVQVPSSSSSDEEDVNVRFPQMLLVVGLRSWEAEPLKQLPALAVMVGFSDSAAACLQGVGKCAKGMICVDGDARRDPRPFCWPCVAASKQAYSSCSVVEKYLWHWEKDEPAEGLVIVQLGCHGTVCELSQITVAVLACGPHTKFSHEVNHKLANKIMAWGTHLLVGMKAPAEAGYAMGEGSFEDYIPFVEKTLRLKPLAHLQPRHFTGGGSVLWTFGHTQHGKTAWFLHSNIRCKQWETGTIARIGGRDKERSAAALQKRFANQQARKQKAPWRWVEPCRRSGPVRCHVELEEEDF